MKSFRIILRYFIDPSSDVDYYINELADFCVHSQIEEVMLLLTAEELSAGHMTSAELELYCHMGQKLKTVLSAQGIDLSLNPWTTLYQVPRGRTLREGQNFRTMIGETGQASPLVACPLCPEWQRQLSSSFATLAKELSPLAIWIEDDWRLHNHGPELGWGGCFCQEHLRRFSQSVGQKVSRDQLLDAILAPGVPHPWRRAWSELSRQSLLEPLEVIRYAVKQANPRTRLALMSSRPDQHSVEGRSWKAIQEGFRFEPRFMIRPHMEPYTEERALRTTPSVTRQTIACLMDDIEVYPELENSPRNGIYSKSARYTAWEMLESAVIGSDGITINSYDNMGSGIDTDPELGKTLAATKPVLNALAALGIDDRKADGVQVLFSPEIANHLQLPESDNRAKADPSSLALQMQLNPSGGNASDYVGSMQSLVHPSHIWAETCAILGIAYRFTSQILPANGPILVNGQTLNAYEDVEIEKLLSGFVVLDALATETLFQRGYGESIGVRDCQWRELSKYAYSYEALEPCIVQARAGMKRRLCAQRNSEQLLEISSSPHSVPLSYIHAPDHTLLWPGCLINPTPQGGKVVCLTYPMNGSSQFFMAFFNKYRRLFFQNLFLQNPSGGKLLMSPDGTRCYRSETAQGTLFSVLNSSLDTLRGFELRHDNSSLFTNNWLYLADDGQWLPIAAQQHGGSLYFGLTIEPLKGQYLRHSPQP